MRRFFGIISALLLLCCSCAVDPEVPTDTPYITCLSTEEVGTNTATIAGFLVGTSYPGYKYILHIKPQGSEGETTSYTATPNVTGRIEWKVEGLVPETSYTFHSEIDSGHGSIESQQFTFETERDYIYIKSDWLRDYLLNLYDLDHNGKLSYEEGAQITRIQLYEKPVLSLDGIEKMTSLQMLDCRQCQITGTVDLSNCAQIEQVILTYNSVSKLILSHHPYLTILGLQYNPITDLNLDGAPNLTCLELSGGLVKPAETLERELPKVPGLRDLAIYTLNLTTVDLSMLPKLRFIDCRYSKLKVLDLSHCADTMTNVLASPQRDYEEIDTIYVRAGQYVNNVTVNLGQYNFTSTSTVVVEK